MELIVFVEVPRRHRGGKTTFTSLKISFLNGTMRRRSLCYDYKQLIEVIQGMMYQDQKWGRECQFVKNGGKMTSLMTLGLYGSFHMFQCIDHSEFQCKPRFERG